MLGHEYDLAQNGSRMLGIQIPTRQVIDLPGQVSGFAVVVQVFVERHGRLGV